MNELFGVDIRKQLFPQKRKKKRHLDGGILGNLKSDDTVERHGTSAKAKLRRKRKQLSVLASLSCNMDKHEKSVLVDIPSNPPFNSSSLGGSGVLAEIGNLGATQTHLKRKDTKTKKLMKGKKQVQTSVLEILSCDSTTNMAHQSPHLRSGKAYEETKRLISFSSDVRKRRNSKHNAQKRCQEKRKLDSTKGEEKTQIRKKKKSTGGDEFENKRARSNVGPRRNIERESICMEDLEKQSRESGLLNDTSHEDLKQYSIADESVSVSCPSPLSLLPDLAIKETSTSHVDKSLEENKKVTSEAINDEMPKEMPRDVIPSDTIVVKTNVTASCKSYMRLFQEDNTSDATRTKKKLEPEGNKAISKHFHSDQVDGDVCSDIDNQSQFDNNSIRLEKEGDTQSSTLKEIQSERKVEAPRITKEDASRPTGARTPHEAQSFAVDDSMSASSTSNSIPVFVQFYDHAKNEQILESGSAADHSSLSTCSKAKIPAGQPMLSGDDDEKEVSTGIRNPGSIHLEESVSSEKKCFCGIEGSGDLEHKTGKIAASASTADAYGSCVLEIDYLVPFCASSKADVPGPHTLEIDCYLQSHAASKIPKTKEIGLGGVVPLPHSALELPTDATETKVNPPENCIKSVTSPLSDSIFSNIDHDSPTTHRKCKDQIREGTSMRSRKITKSGDEKKNKFEATSGNQRKSLRQRIKTNRYSPTIKRRKRPQKDRFAKTTEVDVPISNEVERGLTIEESAVSGKVCSTSEHHEKLDLTSSEMKKNRQRKSMRQRIKTNRYSPPIESRKVAQNDCFAQKSQTDASILNKIEQGSSNEESVISGNAQWEPESHRRLDSVTENLVKPGSRTVADTISGQRKSSRQRIKTNRYSPCIESRKRTNDDLFSSNNSEEDITTSVKLEPVCNNREHLIPQTMCLLPNANEQMETAAENTLEGGNEEKEINIGQGSESREWTDTQLAALRKAYISVDPRSDHFWSEISRNVQGKSEEECGEKWFDLVETPARKVKKNNSRNDKTGALTANKVINDDEDDLFNATPLKSYEDQGTYNEQGSALFNIGLSPIVDEGKSCRNVATEYDDLSESGPLVSRAGYKSYVQNLRRDISKARKVDRKKKHSLTRTKACTLSDKVGHGDFKVDGCLTPGGTLRVRTVDCNQEEDDFFGSDSED